MGPGMQGAAPAGGKSIAVCQAQLVGSACSNEHTQAAGRGVQAAEEHGRGLTAGKEGQMKKCTPQKQAKWGRGGGGRA